MQTQSSSPSQFLIATPILHSHSLTHIDHLKLFIEGQQRKGLLLVKSTTIEVALLDDDYVYDWFEIPVYQPIIKVTVIPTKYKRSDIVFVLTAKAFVFFRWTDGKVEVLARGQGRGESGLPGDSKYGAHCGMDYHFNVNDTEGYLFFTIGPLNLTVLTFNEKSSGFKLLSQNSTQISSSQENITYIGAINQKHSKYKTPSIGVVFDSEGKSHLRLYSCTNPVLTQLEHLKLTRTTILHFLSAKDFIILTTRQILFYGYYSNKPTMTHRLPVFQCVQKILQLEDVYCAAGDQLILFTKQGTKQYGEIGCSSAVHIGGNRLLLSHQDEDIRLVQLEENCVKELHRWLNLSNIFSVEVVPDGSMETFVVVSPNRKKQLTILTKAQTARPVATEQLDQPITKLQKINYKDNQYILASLMDESMMLMRVVSTGLEEIGRLDFKFMVGVGELVVLSTGIVKIDYERPTLELIYDCPVEKASVSDQTIILGSQKFITAFSVLQRKVRDRFEVNGPISALANTNDMVWYAGWSTKKVEGRWLADKGSREQNWSISTEAQARTIIILKEYIFIGQSKGIVEVYHFDKIKGPILHQRFLCGTLPVTLSTLSSTSLLCISDKTLLLTISSSFIIQKSLLSLKSLSSAVQLPSISPHDPVLLLTCSRTSLTLYELHKTQQLNRHSIKVCEPTEMPFVKVVKGKAYIFRKEEVQIIEVASLERSTVSCQIDQVQVVEGCNEGILVVGSFGRAKDRAMAYFKDGREIIRYPLKKMPLCVRFTSKNRILLGGQSEIKIISFDESIPKFTDQTTSQLSINCVSACSNPSGNKLLIVDPFKTVVLYEYPQPNNKLNAVARICCDRMCNDIAYLSTVMLVCDKSGNLISLQPNLKAANDLEKIRLDIRGGVNLGEQIWTFTPKTRELIYGTGQGTIGRVREITEKQYTVLWEVQKAAIKDKSVDILETVDRDLKMQFVEVKQVGWKNGILDGEILKAVARLQPQSLRLLLGMTSLTIEPQRLLKLIEEVCL